MTTLTFAASLSNGKVIPLQKIVKRAPTGDPAVISYPGTMFYTTRNQDVSSLDEFAKALINAGDRGECLFKGSLMKPLIDESRLGALSNQSPTDWVCLDFDKIPSLSSVEDIVDEIDELRNVSYVIQYASSHMLGGRFSAHVFMFLEKPVISRVLEAWLVHLNLTEAALARHVKLNPAGLSVSWPLDPVPARNTQIIYIAPPKFEGMHDPVKGQRVRIVKKKRDKLFVPQFPPPEEIAKQRRKRLRDLRVEAGLSPVRYKSIKGHTVIDGANATVSEIVDMNDRYVRVNLNGGDSAAYWFWRHDPSLLYSFKDETEVYKLEDLDSEFYKKYTGSPEYKELTDKQLVAFMEQGTTSGYRVGMFDPKENEFYMRDELIPEPWLVSKDKFIEFLKFIEFNPRTFIVPPGFSVFDPKDLGSRFDQSRNRVNRFRATRFMYAQPKVGELESLCPAIWTLINSVLGAERVVDHFLKWFALLFNERSHVGTSWLLQGKQGTGKSMLVHNVMAPLIGETNFALITPNDLADRFNDYIAEKLLVFIDEADLNKVSFASGLLNSRIKSIVGNKRASVRKMYKAVTQIENFSNLILATNTMNAVTIAMDDRRFNVSDYQLKSLPERRIDVPKFIKDLSKELDGFAAWLLACKVDPVEVSQPLQTTARTQIQEHTLPSIEHVTRLINQGDLELLFSFISREWTPGSYDLAASYEKVLMRWLHRPSGYVTREELLAVYKFHVPKFMRDYVGPISEGRFLGTQGFNAYTRKIDGLTQRVYVVDIKIAPDLKKIFPIEKGASNVVHLKKGSA